MAGESVGGTGGSSVQTEEGSSGGGDIEDIIKYLNHRSFGVDGDYTDNGGYGGDDTGPVGSKPPAEEDNGAVALLNAMTAMPNRTFGSPSRRAGGGDIWREIEPYTGFLQTHKESLFAYVGQEVDPYSGLTIGSESIDPFTGTRVTDPFTAWRPSSRAGKSAAFGAIRRNSLLSSPNLIADNSGRATYPPKMMSDANESSLANIMQAEVDQSYLAILDHREGKAQIAGSPTFDMHEAASQAARVTSSGEHQLAFLVNHLQTHPLEVQRSGVSVGIGHMASGGFVGIGSALVIYGSGGLALPLIGGMGLATGIADFSSGLALAFSGASSTEAIRMGSQLDQAFALTSSPTSLVFGTTGLVLSDGRADVAYRFAIVGGIAENLATLRGDPSKLYAAVLPRLATKAEKGAAALLVKDVAALGHTAPAERIETVATKLSRDFAVDDLLGIAAFREELASSHRLDLAGNAGHEAYGAAGSGGGVDVLRYGAFAQELKFHGPNTGIVQWQLDKASTQSLNYSIKFQLETRAFGEQLVQIRSVKHFWISPTEAVMYVGH